MSVYFNNSPHTIHAHATLLRPGRTLQRPSHAVPVPCQSRYPSSRVTLLQSNTGSVYAFNFYINGIIYYDAAT